MNRALLLPENMLHSTSADMTVLERQRASLKLQQDHLQLLQNHLQLQLTDHHDDNPNFNFTDLLNSGFFMGQGMQQQQGFSMEDRPVKPDPGHEWSELDQVSGVGFGGSSNGYGNGSGFDLGFGISRTASCPSAVNTAAAAEALANEGSVLTGKLSGITGRDSFKKRKHEKVATKNESKKSKGCGEEGDSKITDINNASSNNNSNIKNTNKNQNKNKKDQSSDTSKVSDKTDYIHVRARRGQATDSHSLAERVRREKISERMKYLQDLVPGCNKITGKAGMLDEIINYVQSLQRQVEFLSMKLAAVNPTTLDFNMEDLFSKEICQANFPVSSPEIAMPTYLQFSSCEMEMGMGMGMGMNPNPADLEIKRTISAPIPDSFIQSSCYNQIQQPPTWDSEFQNLYNNVGVFDQARSSTSFQCQHFTGSNDSGILKMEM